MSTILQTTFSSSFSFLYENGGILILISLKFIPKGPTSSIDSYNGLSPTMLQAIIWTNDG